MYSTVHGQYIIYNKLNAIHLQFMLPCVIFPEVIPLNGAWCLSISSVNSSFPFIAAKSNALRSLAYFVSALAPPLTKAAATPE